MIDIQAQVEAMHNYRDNFELITQADRDGGDTANRTGAYYIYLKYLNVAKDDDGLGLADGLAVDLGRLQSSPGRYRRHPDSTHWYSNPENLSRDQSIQLQGAMAVYGFKERAWALIKQRAKRLFFHFNAEEGDDDPTTKKTKFPDPPAPIEFSQFVRATGAILLWPSLWITDVQLVIDVGISRHYSIDGGSKDFDSNYLPILLSCSSKYWTPWVWLARKIYAKKTDVPERLRIYFKEGPGYNGLAPLGELAVASYEKLQKETGD